MKIKSFAGILIVIIVIHGQRELFGQNEDLKGIYFPKINYDCSEIPVYNNSKNRLPNPILEENSEWIDMYWKCWEIAFQHFKKPSATSPFVSNIMDEAFNENIFQWDMIFMVMFARYGHDVFPAVNSLDNFYCRQHITGYMCREISEIDGSDFVYEGRKNTINPPLFSWAEVESFKITGDMSRFEMVLPVLEQYVEWLNRDGDLLSANGKEWYNYGRRAANSVHHLYWNTGLGSGMDNTPRGGNGWVDMSCQMVIQYTNLAMMSRILGQERKETYFINEAKKIADRINQYCWDENDGLYYDVDSAGNPVKWKTAGCFWPMLAGIASKEQCTRLVSHLTDTAAFWRRNVFPTLAADQTMYNPKGEYWLGSVWSPTNYMIIKGLENNGYEELATKSTYKYLTEMYCVFDRTQTVWENYSPEYCSPGSIAKPDFVGWTGIGPIALLIENILGFRVNGFDQTLTWFITRTDDHGIENLKVGNANVNALCTKRESEDDLLFLSVSSDKELKLIVHFNHGIKQFDLVPGEHQLTIDETGY